MSIKVICIYARVKVLVVGIVAVKEVLFEVAVIVVGLYELVE